MHFRAHHKVTEMSICMLQLQGSALATWRRFRPKTCAPQGDRTEHVRISRDRRALSSSPQGDRNEHLHAPATGKRFGHLGAVSASFRRLDAIAGSYIEALWPPGCGFGIWMPLRTWSPRRGYVTSCSHGKSEIRHPALFQAPRREDIS